MELIGDNQIEKGGSDVGFNLYTDPLAFYIFVLISTNSATTPEAIAERFSRFPELLGYVKKTLIALEGAGATYYDSGRYRVQDVFHFDVLGPESDNSFLPNLFSKVTERIVKDASSGQNVAKSSHAQFYFLPDSPIKRAKVNALISDFNKKIKQIIVDDYANDSHPTRFVGVISSVADAEDMV